MGTARFNMDNQGWFFVNEVLAGTTSTNWQQTAVFEFQADCTLPTVYAIVSVQQLFVPCFSLRAGCLLSLPVAC